MLQMYHPSSESYVPNRLGLKKLYLFSTCQLTLWNCLIVSIGTKYFCAYGKRSTSVYSVKMRFGSYSHSLLYDDSNIISYISIERMSKYHNPFYSLWCSFIYNAL